MADDPQRGGLPPGNPSGEFDRRGQPTGQPEGITGLDVDQPFASDASKDAAQDVLDRGQFDTYQQGILDRMTELTRSQNPPVVFQWNKLVPVTDGDWLLMLADIPSDGAGVVNVTTVTATYTILLSDVVILCDGTFTVTLPTAVGVEGKKYHIKNIGTGVITVEGNGAETIDEALNQTLTQYEAIHLTSDNVEWWIL